MDKGEMKHMIGLNYDLHIHSCLSPCGDDDMTPANIAGMAAVKELDVIALTDHNSCKNCPAFLEAARVYGILAIPGMELTTLEEVHVVCLFPSLDKAMAFDQFVYSRLIPVPNKPDIFGKQQILNEEDKIIGTVPNLLINSTQIPFDDAYDLVKKYGGIMIPAHVDKNANSLLCNLGFVPPNSQFTCFEVKNMANLHSVQASNPYLKKCNVITDSDAHYLEDINEPINTLYVKEKTVEAVFEGLKNLL